MRRLGRICTPLAASSAAASPRLPRRRLPALPPFLAVRTASSYSCTAVPRSTPACAQGCGAVLMMAVPRLCNKPKRGLAPRPHASTRCRGEAPVSTARSLSSPPHTSPLPHTHTHTHTHIQTCQQAWSSGSRALRKRCLVRDSRSWRVSTASTPPPTGMRTTTFSSLLSLILAASATARRLASRRGSCVEGTPRWAGGPCAVVRAGGHPQRLEGCSTRRVVPPRNRSPLHPPAPRRGRSLS
jgi:hypothetical protein